MRYKLRPWEHQFRAYQFLNNKLINEGEPGAALFMDMGTGKSKVTIDYINNMPTLPKLTVIFCPKAVAEVWPREYRKHAVDDYQIINLVGTSKNKRAGLVRMASNASKKQRVVIICNYESAYREPLKEWFLKQKIDLLVCDESHKLKSPSGKASRFISNVAKRANKRLLLTGTPLPHGPEDIYGQFRTMNPEIFGKSVTRFRNKYSYQWGEYSSQRTWFTDEKAKSLSDVQRKFGEEYKQKIEQNAFRVKASEALDLPEALHENINITLPPKALKHYLALQEDFITWLDNGEAVTAANALVKLLRLQQLTGGFLEDQQIHTAKIDAVKEIVDGVDEPVVIFTKFRDEMDGLKKALKGYRIKELSGRMRELGEGATYPEDTDVLICQIQAGNAGIDLTAARICIYYSVGFNKGNYDQSLARVHRPGQDRKVLYYHLVAKGTVDEYVRKNLDAKGDMVKGIMEVFKN